jgi:hypothetical protein
MKDLYIQTIGNSKGLIVEYVGEIGPHVQVITEYENKLFPFLILKTQFNMYYKKYIPERKNKKRKKL